MKKGIIFFSTLLSILIAGCSQAAKEPCVKNLNCDDCNCIFDELQKNTGDRARMDSLRACYEKCNK